MRFADSVAARSQIARSWQGRTARRLRKKVEMLFAYLKRILKLDRIGSCGLQGRGDLDAVSGLRHLGQVSSMHKVKDS
jgi:hypothetical protein